MELSELLTETGLAYFLILTVAFYDFKNRIGVWKEILPVSVLSFLQLFLIGFVILYLIKLDNEFLNLLVVLIMTVNASFIASKRFDLKGYGVIPVFVSSFGAIALINYLLLFLYNLFSVISLKANMFIPFAGLLIAAGMRSISLFSQYIKDLLIREKDILEGFYAIGAADSYVKNYLLKKGIPLTTVVIRDMLKAAGIVHIPGVMVGLLLAGSHPIFAAAMQFLVLSSMLFSMFFTPIVFFIFVISLEGIKLQK
jgi:putative ABC transport system permease protein